MGREPRSSTLNTHNSALNRIFDEAVARGYMNKLQVPVLVNKGRDSVRRPDRCTRICNGMYLSKLQIIFN
jgi:hypothetical protein